MVVSALQRDNCVCVYIEKEWREQVGEIEIYYKELAHVIMEAKKSQDLQSSKLEIQESWWCSSSLSLKAWEPGEPIVYEYQSESRQTWHRRRAIVSVQVWRQEKNNVPAQGSQAGGIPSFLQEGLPFVLFKYLDEAHPHKGRQSAVFSLPNQLLISSRNT